MNGMLGSTLWQPVNFRLRPSAFEQISRPFRSRDHWSSSQQRDSAWRVRAADTRRLHSPRFGFADNLPARGDLQCIDCFRQFAAIRQTGQVLSLVLEAVGQE